MLCTDKLRGRQPSTKSNKIRSRGLTTKVVDATPLGNR